MTKTIWPCDKIIWPFHVSYCLMMLCQWWSTKYSEILLHGFRMANFGHEMADGQLLCYIQIVHVYIHVCVLTYWYVRICNCNGNCITTMCVSYYVNLCCSSYVRTCISSPPIFSAPQLGFNSKGMPSVLVMECTTTTNVNCLYGHTIKQIVYIVMYIFMYSR